MPRIWIDYCQFLVDQCKVTRSRHTFDRALRALPITQHRRIWPIYLKFVRKYHIPETAVRVYRRYLKVSADILYYLCKQFCFFSSDAFNKIASSCLVEDSLICTLQILLFFLPVAAWKHRGLYWLSQVCRMVGWGSNSSCFHCQQGIWCVLLLLVHDN